MRERLEAELHQFERGTLPYCSTVTVEQFREWRHSRRSQSTDRGAQRRVALPSHSGRKDLLDYQEELVEIGCLSLGEAGNRAVVSLPTGAGKTFTAMHLLFRLLERGYRRILWLAPQRLLLEQAQNELQASWYSTKQSVGLDWYDKAGFDAASEAVAIIRFDTLQLILRQKAEILEPKNRPDIVVIDEAHHLEANQFGLLAARLSNVGATVIGLTATPGRSNASELDSLRGLFGGQLLIPASLGSDPIAALKARGVYSQIDYRKLKPGAESADDRVLRRHARQKGQSRQRSFAFIPGRLDAIVEAVALQGKDARSLVFGHSIAHSIVLCAALCCNDVPAEIVGSEFGLEHNDVAIAKFRKSEIQCLVNVKYAAVGADFPFVNAAFLSVPINSPIFFEQVVGRIARGPAVGGTESARLYDFDGHLQRFGGIQSYRRFQLDWT